MAHKRFGVAGCLTALLAWLFGAGDALAGGGPENVFLVVNSASWASQTVANHYIQLRHIPSSNVFYVDWTGGCETTDVDSFRDKILGPALDATERRGLRQQIDYLVYSSDFPYAVDLTNDFAGRFKFPETATPGCSINSATYLWNLVYSKLPIVMDFHINHYMRDFVKRETDDPTHGFRSWYGWGNQGELQESGGQPYLLSTMLAMTSGRGNSVREALAYLERSAAADGTHPSGTIYFSKTDDKRATPRIPGFEQAVAQLKSLGVRADVISTPLPMGRSDVAGAMTGTAEFSWASSRSKILPGAICENLTSFGGVLGEGSGQTPLTEFLRYGAAGSCGTVVEPLALPQKFPWPSMHVHYARGSTLAEAFYQSVFGPAQVLIVGDALCRPWANIPEVTVAGVKAGDKVSGTLVLKPTAKLPKGGEIERFTLFVDGRRLDSAGPGEDLKWDSTPETDGYHELRVVATEASPIETQGRAIIPVTVENSGHQAQLSTVPAKRVRWDETLTVRAKAPGMKQIFVVHNGRPLGSITGEEGELMVNPRTLGLGPVTFDAVGLGEANSRDRVVAAPVSLVVEPPKPLPALNNAPQKLGPGLALKLPSGKVVTVQETRDPAWPAIAGLDQNQQFTAQAFFDVATEDVYQFQAWHYGQLKISVNGTVIYEGDQGNFKQKYLPLALAAGRHRLTLTGRTASDVKLRILFGGPGAMSLNGRMFRHQTR
jgi:uncharacterized protein (TIGR03790 family)